EAALCVSDRRGRSDRVAAGAHVLPGHVETEPRGAAVSATAQPGPSGNARSLPAGLLQSHARLSSAGEEPEGRSRGADALAENRPATRAIRTRAFFRVRRLSGDRPGRQHHRNVRPQDHAKSPAGNAAAYLSAGAAP